MRRALSFVSWSHHGRCCAAASHCGTSQHPWSRARVQRARVPLLSTESECMVACGLFSLHMRVVLVSPRRLQHINNANTARHTPTQMHTCMYMRKHCEGPCREASASLLPALLVFFPRVRLLTCAAVESVCVCVYVCARVCLCPLIGCVVARQQCKRYRLLVVPFTQEPARQPQHLATSSFCCYCWSISALPTTRSPRPCWCPVGDASSARGPRARTWKCAIRTRRCTSRYLAPQDGKASR